MSLKFFFTSALFATVQAYASSAVYNGGDTVDAFLEATRTTPLLNTLSDIRAENEAGALQPLCTIEPLAHLSTNEQQFCHEFIVTTVDAVRRMNSGSKPVELKTQMEPLYVPDPNGVLRPVKAVTLLDSTSPVIFHYDSIKNMAPKDLLSLMTHEFGHKVPFNGSFVTDNEPIGPFVAGRRLLDSIGIALSNYAVKKNRVGEVYGLADYFSCKIYQEDFVFPSLPVSLRYFPTRGNYDSFESGIGIFPSDVSQCYLQNLKNERIAMNFRIHEELGCAQNQDANKRYTFAELVWLPAPGESEKPKQLTQKLMPNWNPLCLEKPTEGIVELSTLIGTRQVKFEIRYERSMGTIVPLSLQRGLPGFAGTPR